jgi:hypothetical protein
MSGQDASYCNLPVQVFPVWIGVLDQVQLPGSIPFFQLPLALERRFSALMFLEPNQKLDAVFSSKALYSANPMFPDTAYQVVGHADIKSAITPARQNVHVEAQISSAPGFPLARE